MNKLNMINDTMIFGGVGQMQRIWALLAILLRRC